jgi:hypothetical protein
MLGRKGRAVVPGELCIYTPLRNPSGDHFSGTAKLKISIMPKLAKGFLGLLVISNSYEPVLGKQPETCTGFPSNLVEFSSSFQQPAPPSVNNEFKANWIQHKW